MHNNRYFKTLVGLAVAGLIIGTWGVANVLLDGKRATALGSYVSWGLWVAVYLFFLGLTAGAFLITILTYVFRVKIFAPIGPLSAFTVLVAITCEVIIISFDLGHFSRVWRFLVNPGGTSMIFWMVAFTNAMIIIYSLECYFLLRESLVEGARQEGTSARWLYRLLSFGKTDFTETDRMADHRRVRVLSIISLPVGLIFYGIDGAIFAILLNRPIWNALTPLFFIVTAACFLIILTFIAVRLNFVIPDQAVYKLEGLEATFYHWRLRTDQYFPNLNEWLVSLGVFFLGLLAFMLGSKYLPIVSAGKGEAEHVAA